MKIFDGPKTLATIGQLLTIVDLLFNGWLRATIGKYSANGTCEFQTSCLEKNTS